MLKNRNLGKGEKLKKFKSWNSEKFEDWKIEKWKSIVAFYFKSYFKSSESLLNLKFMYIVKRVVSRNKHLRRQTPTSHRRTARHRPPWSPVCLVCLLVSFSLLATFFLASLRPWPLLCSLSNTLLFCCLPPFFPFLLHLCILFSSVLLFQYCLIFGRLSYY